MYNRERIAASPRVSILRYQTECAHRNGVVCVVSAVVLSRFARAYANVISNQIDTRLHNIRVLSVMDYGWGLIIGSGGSSAV